MSSRASSSASDGLSRPAFLTFMSVAAFGTLLTAAYLLVVVRRVCMGDFPDIPAVAAAPATVPEPGDLPAAEPGPDAESGPAAPEPGPASASAAASAAVDVRGHELAAWTPLVALTVLAGLWPAALIGLSDPAVQNLLGGGS